MDRITRELDISSIDLSPEKSTAVISSAQKFIIPIPNLGDAAEALINPETKEPIKDYKGNPVQGRGVVFYNGADRTPQAVLGDGSGVIIINEVGPTEAKILNDKIREMAGSPQNLNLDQIKEVLDFTSNRLMLKDMYNSNRNFVKSKMSHVSCEDVNSNVECFGLMKRDDRDICQAVFVRGAFTLRAGSETERVHHFENGGVIVKQGSDIRGVQPEIFARTYRKADGAEIKSPVDDLKWA